MLDGIAACLKAVLYASLLSAAGVALTGASLRPPADVARYAVRLMRIAAAATLIASLASALLLLVRLGGALDAPTLSAVFMSGAGATLALQVSGALLLLTSFGDDAFAHGWRISSALMITVSFAFSGHAPTMSASAGWIAFAHVTAAAWWVGSLWHLERICASNDTPTAVAVVMRFTTVAMFVIMALLIAGSVLILALVDFERSPWVTDYVVSLSAKLAFVALVLGVAAYNKLRLTPRIRAHDAVAVSALRRMVRIELVIIAGVLIATAILTTYFSPHE